MKKTQRRNPPPRKQTKQGPTLGFLYGTESIIYMWVCFGSDITISEPCKLVGVLAERWLSNDKPIELVGTSATNCSRGSCGWLRMTSMEKVK